MTIAVNNLSKYFYEGARKKDVLKGVDLEVRQGEIFALLGANGAGKTTLLKIIATLISPNAGQGSVAGHDILSQQVHVRRSIGFVFGAENSFYQILNVEENLHFFASLHGLSRAAARVRVKNLLGDLKLEPWAKVRISHCSSGIRQKLAIARALIHEPAVLLIDELTRSLDRGSVEEVTRYVSEYITSTDKSCILVTHDRTCVQELSCRVGTLRDGIIDEHTT